MTFAGSDVAVPLPDASPGAAALVALVRLLARQAARERLLSPLIPSAPEHDTP